MPAEVLDVNALFSIVSKAVANAKNKLEAISNNKDQISIADMFEMQFIVNQMSQLSDMTTNVVSATHQAISTMTRNIKG